MLSGSLFADDEARLDGVLLRLADAFFADDRNDVLLDVIGVALCRFLNSDEKSVVDGGM